MRTIEVLDQCGIANRFPKPRGTSFGHNFLEISDLPTGLAHGKSTSSAFSPAGPTN